MERTYDAVLLLKRMGEGLVAREVSLLIFNPTHLFQHLTKETVYVYNPDQGYTHSEK